MFAPKKNLNPSWFSITHKVVTNCFINTNKNTDRNEYQSEVFDILKRLSENIIELYSLCVIGSQLQYPIIFSLPKRKAIITYSKIIISDRSSSINNERIKNVPVYLQSKLNELAI